MVSASVAGGRCRNVDEARGKSAAAYASESSSAPVEFGAG